MPVRADDVLADLGTDAAAAATPGASQSTSPLGTVWSPPLGLAGPSLSPILADSHGLSRFSRGDAAGVALASVDKSSVAEAGTHSALANQFDSFRAFTDAVAFVAESLDRTAALWAALVPDVAAAGAAAPSLPPAAVVGADLTLLSDLHRPPAALGAPGLDGFAALPAIDDLLPGLRLARGMVEAAKSLGRQVASPLHEAAQGILAMSQSAWRFDAARLWAPSVTGLAERLEDRLHPAAIRWIALEVLFAATEDPTGIDPDLVAASVDRLVEAIPWRPHDARVRRAIAAGAEREGASPGAVMRRELRAAVFLAVAARDAPQAMRFGAQWLKGDDGRKAALPPRELPTSWFWQWLSARAIAIAEASVLEQPHPAGADVLDRPPRHDQPRRVVSLDAGWEHTDGRERLDLLLVSADDPLAALVAGDDRAEDAALVRAVLAAASPRQRELAALLAAGCSEAEAARHLGMAPATARVQVHRLRRKAV